MKREKNPQELPSVSNAVLEEVGGIVFSSEKTSKQGKRN